MATGNVPEQLAARYRNPVNERRFAAALALAEKHGVSINEVVLGYLLCQPFQTIPIFGASSVEQLESSVKAAALSLSADECTELRAA